MSAARRLLYVFCFLGVLQGCSMGWTAGTYVNYVTTQEGEPLENTFALNAAFMLTGTLLDPATGSFADIYGQRQIYLLGQIFWALATFMYGYSSGMVGFFQAEILAAIGRALISNALASWVVNNYGRRIGKLAMIQHNMMRRLFSLPSAVLGAYIGYNYSLELPWYLECAVTILLVVSGAVLLFSLKENVYRDKVIKDKSTDSLEESSKGSFKDSLKLLRTNKKLQFLSFQQYLLYFCLMSYNMLWAKYMEINFSSTIDLAIGVGVLWVVASLSLALGAWLAKSRRISALNNGNSLQIILVVIGLPMMVPYFYTSFYLFLVCFAINEVGRGFYEVQFDYYMHRHIPDHIRSVTSSFVSSVATLGAFSGLLAGFFQTPVFSITEQWLISSVLLTVVGILLMKPKIKI